jgi:uncharacterized protein
MRALLDVNVLIALHDRDHVHDIQAAIWFETNVHLGWASCPLTQNGCLRIMSQAGYGKAQPLSVLIEMLGQSTQSVFHETWPDDVSMLSAKHFNHQYVHSSAQITDLCLLGLAVKNNGRLVSFDRRIPVSAVVGAQSENLVLLAST